MMAAPCAKARRLSSRSFSAGGYYVWSHALDSFEGSEDGIANPQDSGYLGAPFTSSNNSLGAAGGGIQEEYGLSLIHI